MATRLDTIRLLSVLDRFGSRTADPTNGHFALCESLHNEGLLKREGPFGDNVYVYEITPAGQAELDRLRDNHEEAKRG